MAHQALVDVRAQLERILFNIDALSCEVPLESAKIAMLEEIYIVRTGDEIMARSDLEHLTQITDAHKLALEAFKEVTLKQFWRMGDLINRVKRRDSKFEVVVAPASSVAEPPPKRRKRRRRF